MILPTYNRAYVLWKAISSVLAQTEYNWELIVVDDGSTDNTPGSSKSSTTTGSATYDRPT